MVNAVSNYLINKLKRGIKDHDFDFYRWIGYVAALVIIAFASMVFPILYWAFLIILVIGFGDFLWHKFNKYTHVRH
ncbi:MAG: hypothetical protein J4472_02005 [DPANN group archaeon]|nr:hypothetical protein [DPANN group archaeon]